VIAGPPLTDLSDHPFLKWEDDVQYYGETQMADAPALGKIESSSTFEAVKRVMISPYFDERTPAF